MPLRVHPVNPCWLADESGRARFLTGSHHWDVLLDNAERPGAFPFERHLDQLVGWGHSVVRLWAHEAWTHDLSHSPWLRTGPGRAADGRPRFDLERFDEAYFARLRARAVAAGARGLHVVVMLWNGWSLRDNGDGNPWPRHPFHRDNNVNGVDGDPDRRGNGDDVHSLRLPPVTRLQQRYVDRVVDAIGDLDFVLWEISNESPPSSRDWQRAMLRHLRVRDAARGPAHPIGLTACHPRAGNGDLFASAAEWVSPNRHDGWRRGRWMRTPPPNDGAKVVLLDTDHLWGIGGDVPWVWRSALRGHQPLYMDPLDEDPAREPVRRAMGVARRVLEEAGLETLSPRPELASSGVCLGPAGGGGATIVAWTGTRRLTVQARELGEGFTAEWIHPVTGERQAASGPAPWPDGAVLVVRAAAPRHR